jgi:hypothetical protein
MWSLSARYGTSDNRLILKRCRRCLLQKSIQVWCPYVTMRETSLISKYRAALTFMSLKLCRIRYDRRRIWMRTKLDTTSPERCWVDSTIPTKAVWWRGPSRLAMRSRVAGWRSNYTNKLLAKPKEVFWKPLMRALSSKLWKLKGLAQVIIPYVKTKKKRPRRFNFHRQSS